MGILIVEFANQKRKLGMNKRVAAFEAASARFRPILMTSLATIFGGVAYRVGAWRRLYQSCSARHCGGGRFVVLAFAHVVCYSGYLYHDVGENKEITFIGE